MPTPFTGLLPAEIQERVAAGKVNVTNQRSSRSLRDILRANLFTRFNALLGLLFIIVITVGSPIDGLFGIVIIINSGIGIFQEVRAKRTLDKLAILHAPTARVIRESKVSTIPVQQVVLDDILKLQIGDQIPADAVVLQSEGMETDESLLTGESDPVLKKTDDTVLSGAIVVAGEGYVRTTAVGVNAYAHTISVQAKKFSRVSSELIDGTNKLLGYISWLILIVAPLLIWGQIANSGNSWQEAMVRSSAAITGMIPEGLVLLTSLAFALATFTLARRKVLVQQLPAVEGLARVDVLCLDKTGTLTEGKIGFEAFELIHESQPVSELEQVLATFGAEPNSPTLQAFHDAFSKQKPLQTKGTVAFSSSRKWSAITVASESWILGAPEMVWHDAKSKVRAQANTLAKSGQRVLLLCRTKNNPTTTHIPTKLEAVAFVLLSEKIRPDAKQTLAFFAEQGVAIKVISGDNPRTVGAIARRVGLTVDKPFDARELPTNKRKLAKIMEVYNVFGRVSPEQKQAMVAALQSKGHVVAMTGDGVNDALALKNADIGIAMGNGAQATKAVAELILLDSQFDQMPHVLAEGRRVIANIERVANLFVTKNVYSLVLALAVTVGGLAYPFLPRHMSIISAVTIGIPAFFLALAPNNQRYHPGFLNRVLRFSVPTGAMIGVLIFASYLLVRHTSGSAALASTAAAIVVTTIGIWVLICLARPLNWWKLALILSMGLIFASLVALSFSRTFLDFAVSMPELSWAFGLGLLGAVFVEFLWRFDQRTRT